MFNEDVETTVVLLKDKGKAALAADVEGRWRNIVQTARKTDNTLSELSKRYNHDEDNPAYANDVKSSLYGIKEAVNKLGKNLFEVAKQQTTKTDKPAETGGNANPAKPEKEGWWWKLYEKTLKVVVDAVFERWWPK